MQRVYVTGLGVVSSVGFGISDFWNALIAGKSGISEVDLFDTSSLDRHLGGQVKGFRPRDFLTAAEARRAGRCSAMCIAAARMAMDQAGLTEEQLKADRTSVVLGTTMGEADVISELEEAWVHDGAEARVIVPKNIVRCGATLIAIHVARSVGARGMVQVLPAACAAGNYAIGFAADQIRAGRADVVVTGAAEVLEKLEYAGFCRLGAMAPDTCRPFDQNRKGLILGEGAGLMILESEAHAMARGATLLAEVGGFGLACDAHHITRPHPDGIGSIAAMRRAISSSGLQPEDVDFVNAHGTGTSANDETESRVMHEVFGQRKVPISSVKSMIGHCMGAASALEALTCVMSVQSGVYPPTMGYETPDPACDVNVIANKAQAGKADIVLNNSLAFGGYDAVLCFAKPGCLPDNVGRA
ncbi:MAG: beta-ketoacyl-[acyl-carrier-protein] synthase family protein [Myxococcales bacterium]|nr:MAG: beta-ketoacyl-[acyl-carrier-protein] synthase family protein [Myxococcales bacterium]